MILDKIMEEMKQRNEKTQGLSHGKLQYLLCWRFEEEPAKKTEKGYFVSEKEDQESGVLKAK